MIFKKAKNINIKSTKIGENKYKITTSDNDKVKESIFFVFDHKKLKSIKDTEPRCQHCKEKD